MAEKYDFSGWVTRNDTLCTDGVTIKKDAFKHNDGQRVPLIWQHGHNDINNLLGHVNLVNREEGVYGYGRFNQTQQADVAREAVKHGDIVSMSIGANKVKKQGNNVIHGKIYEVSLVMAPANPGAMIDVVLNHYDEVQEDAILFYSDNLIHSEESEGQPMNIDEANAILKTLSEEQEQAVLAYMEHSQEGTVAEPVATPAKPTDPKDEENETVEDVMNTLSEKQMTAVEAIIEKALSEKGIKGTKESDNIQQSDGGKIMKKNVFETVGGNEDTLNHSAIDQLLQDGFAAESGTFKSALTGSELQHGITNVEVLFPHATVTSTTPKIFKDRNTSAEKIVGKITKSPFSRVKTWTADFTEEEARARGYIKGNEKIEQIFGIAQRETTPQTIYKKQGLDRDDVIDVDFDLVKFVNGEMRMMLIEEMARCALVGDGRKVTDASKVKEDKIRPIFSDDDFYTIKVASASIGALLEDVILALGDYQGSGLPDLYMNPKTASKLRLLKTATGAYLFGAIPSLAAVAATLGVNEIIPTTFLKEEQALLVNLSDYTFGASKGGEITNFDDFDIDFNKLKFLIETRISGALTEPKSAIAITIADVSTPAPLTMTNQVTQETAPAGK